MGEQSSLITITGGILLLFNQISCQSKGLIFAILSAVFFGTFGTFFTIFHTMGFHQMSLMVLAPTASLIFALIQLKINHRKIVLANWKLIILMALHGLIILNGMNYCYAKAVIDVPVGIISVITFCNVIILMITSKIFFHYRITGHKIVAILGALLGISLVLKVFESGSFLNYTGIGWTLLIPVFYGISVTLYKFYLNEGVSWEVIIFWVNISAFLTIWVTNSPGNIISNFRDVMISTGSALPVTLALLGFFLFPMAGSYYTYFRAYQYIEPTYVGLCYALDPVTAAILGLVLFRQSFTTVQFSGVLLILMAILYIKIVEGKEEKLVTTVT